MEGGSYFRVTVLTHVAAILSPEDDCPDFVFLHLDDPDNAGLSSCFSSDLLLTTSAGHTYGFDPNVPEYVDAIEGVDRNVATLMALIERRRQVNMSDSTSWSCNG